jgi:outer membrane protein assembly factor BamA
MAMKIHSLPVFLTVFWMAVILSVVPRVPAQNVPPEIGSIRFEGNRSISTLQLKRFLERSREGRPYLPENLQADLRQVENAYEEAGFLKAELGTPDVQIKTSGNRVVAVIRIVVKEGPLYSTGEIAAKNAGVLAPETLIQLCPLRKGLPYSRRKVADWQARIEDAYRELGYIRIRCLVHEVVKDAAGTVDGTLECVEGKLYSVGKITITGNGSVNPVEFKRRLLVSEGAAFNPEMLATSIQFLNQMPLYEPISSSDVEIKLDDDKGIVDLTFRVLARIPRSPGS